MLRIRVRVDGLLILFLVVDKNLGVCRLDRPDTWTGMNPGAPFPQEMRVVAWVLPCCACSCLWCSALAARGHGFRRDFGWGIDVVSNCAGFMGWAGTVSVGRRGWLWMKATGDV
jgi:hypothetical protein